MLALCLFPSHDRRDQSGNANNATQVYASAATIYSGGSINSDADGKVYADTAGDTGYYTIGTNTMLTSGTFIGVFEHGVDTTLCPIGGTLGPGTTFSMLASSGDSNPEISRNCGTPTFYKNKIDQAPSTRGEMYTAFAGSKLVSTIRPINTSSGFNRTGGNTALGS